MIFSFLTVGGYFIAGENALSTDRIGFKTFKPFKSFKTSEAV